MTWSPRGFEAWRTHYPATPDLSATLAALPTLAPAFVARWEGPDADIDAALPRDVRVVFIRGYLGNWMPGNLVGVVRALRAVGVDAVLARTDTSGPSADNVARLARELGQDRPLLLCGHSRGGLEALAVADRREGAVRGVLLSQTPRGPSRVLESLLLGAHQESLTRPHRRAAEAVQRAGLHLIGASTGGRELTGDVGERLATLDRPRPFPVWQTASWSIRPTAWLDSFHERLGEIRPGVAHDGQFYLEDLLWPGLPHLLLPHLDHAQPAMGGFGFDPARYWKVLIGLATTSA